MLHANYYVNATMLTSSDPFSTTVAVTTSLSFRDNQFTGSRRLHQLDISSKNDTIGNDGL